MAEERQYLRNDGRGARRVSPAPGGDAGVLRQARRPRSGEGRHPSCARPVHDRRNPVDHGLARRQPPGPAHARAGGAGVAQIRSANDVARWPPDSWPPGHCGFADAVITCPEPTSDGRRDGDASGISCAAVLLLLSRLTGVRAAADSVRSHQRRRHRRRRHRRRSPRGHAAAARPGHRHRLRFHPSEFRSISTPATRSA